jgi:uncharacterized protein DUF4157
MKTIRPDRTTSHDDRPASGLAPVLRRAASPSPERTSGKRPLAQASGTAAGLSGPADGADDASAGFFGAAMNAGIHEPEGGAEEQATDASTDAAEVDEAAEEAHEPEVAGTVARHGDGTPHDEAARTLGAAAAGASSALPDGLRQRFEGSLGTDLSGVRVHADAGAATAAAAFGAHAFAHGQDVYFAAGQYRPGTDAGDHLIAHEVAHTVQQRGAAAIQHKLEVSEPGDAAERAADSAADAMVAGQPARVDAGSLAISRQVGHDPAAATTTAPATAAPARSSTRVSFPMSDGPFHWRARYDVTFTDTEIRLLMKVKLTGAAGVTPAQVQTAKTRARAAFTRVWDNRFVFTDLADQHRYNLRTEAQFVDSGEHHRVILHPGSGGTDFDHWHVGDSDTDHAHELGHGLGLRDEYVDVRAPNRATPTSPGVRTDHSIMGNYNTEGRSRAAPRQRHGRRIARGIGGATHRRFSVSRR